MALQGQNAELDYDIASILNPYASGPLYDEIEHLAFMLGRFASFYATRLRYIRVLAGTERAMHFNKSSVREVVVALRGKHLQPRIEERLMHEEGP